MLSFTSQHCGRMIRSMVMQNVPDTSMVMQNVNDHIKEEMVLSHSEKLAITLGLIITPQEPVSWLLRMKGDCCDLLEILTNFIISIMDHALVEITSERYGRIFATNDCSCGQFNWLDLSLSLYYNQCYACVWHGWIKKKILCKLKKMSSKRRWSVQIFKKFCNGMRASSSHRKACVRRVVLMSLLPWKFLSP